MYLYSIVRHCLIFYKEIIGLFGERRFSIKKKDDYYKVGAHNLFSHKNSSKTERYQNGLKREYSGSGFSGKNQSKLNKQIKSFRFANRKISFPQEIAQKPIKLIQIFI